MDIPRRNLKVVIMASGDVALPMVSSLLARNDVEIQTLLTQPDRPAGRGLKVKTSCLKSLALDSQIPVLQPETLRGDQGQKVYESLAAAKSDAFVVMAYGQLIPQRFLDLPLLRAWNWHASLLPRHRGASPIQNAILHGETETGITVMQMVKALDAGPMLFQKRLAIGGDETAKSLHDRLAILGADCVPEWIVRLKSGQLDTEEQDHSQATYAGKLARESGKLRWESHAIELHRVVRALNPWPTAYTSLPGTGKILKVWTSEVWHDLSGEDQPGQVIEINSTALAVATGQGALNLKEVQLEGRKRMPIEEFLHGAGQALRVGMVLGMGAPVD
ncbi:MAG: methionyl-tRNA formyltransferase [Verrucomicrobiales bacterium]